MLLRLHWFWIDVGRGWVSRTGCRCAHLVLLALVIALTILLTASFVKRVCLWLVAGIDTMGVTLTEMLAPGAVYKWSAEGCPPPAESPHRLHMHKRATLMRANSTHLESPRAVASGGCLERVWMALSAGVQLREEHIELSGSRLVRSQWSGL